MQLPGIGVAEVLILVGAGCLCLLLLGAVAALVVWVARKGRANDFPPKG